MDNKTISWSINGHLYPPFDLPASVTELYPAVSLISSNETAIINFDVTMPKETKVQ
jgi:hypothetical protein